MQSTSPAVAIKVLAGILADHPQWRRVGVIGWQKHGAAVEEFRQAGGLGERVARWAYFGSGDERASNVWWTGDADGPPCDAIVVLGSPRKGESAIRSHLLRVGQVEAARRPTPEWGRVVWQGVVEDGSVRRVNGRGYVHDSEWQEAASWLTGSTLRQSLGRARAVLPGGLEAVVVSTEPTGAELAAGMGKPDLAAGVGRVVAELGKIAREEQELAGEQGDASTGVYGGNLYSKTSRENRHKSSLMGRSSGVSVSTLAARLGVEGRRVREWLNLAELRGLAVPWRNGAAVPGKGRGRGTVWRLTETSGDLAELQQEQVETVVEQVEAADPPPDGVVVVGPVDLAVGETTVVGVNRGPPPDPPPMTDTRAEVRPVVAQPWTVRGEPESWSTGRPPPVPRGDR
jgi:hypothetical protein